MNFKCPKCSEDVSLDECYQDEAAENELKTATIRCANQDCPWEGPGIFFRVSKAHNNKGRVEYYLHQG